MAIYNDGMDKRPDDTTGLGAPPTDEGRGKDRATPRAAADQRHHIRARRRQGDRPGHGRRRAALVGPACDIGLPLVGYYTLHGLGAPDWIALLAATVAAGVRLVGVAVWTRRITWFAAMMLAVFGVGLALAFVGGDPRFLLLKDSFSTAAIGIVFLASLAGAHPLTLSAAQTSKPAEAEDLAALYRTEPAARRAFRISALGWGLGLLAEATVRVPLIYLIPLDVAVGLSTAMMIAFLIGLFIWNAAYITRAAHRNPALVPLLPAPARTRMGT
jgi:hypothetical protein